MVVFGKSQGPSFLNDGVRTPAGSKKRREVSEILLNYEEWKTDAELIDGVKHAVMAPVICEYQAEAALGNKPGKVGEIRFMRSRSDGQDGLFVEA